MNFKTNEVFKILRTQLENILLLESGHVNYYYRNANFRPLLAI